ncbi:hypothetical protein C8R45DRAFT_1038583, partial [Mycena sanguinolenta]
MEPATTKTRSSTSKTAPCPPCSAELERTGMSTPFVFNSIALDVRRTGVARLIRASLAICGGSSSHGYSSNGSKNVGGGDKFANEARLAAAYELGMCLRWGLSRVVRVEVGHEIHGLLSCAWYERWRVEEGGECFICSIIFFGDFCGRFVRLAIRFFAFRYSVIRRGFPRFNHLE